jgi:two-component system KDP operon response regulator KdpE
MTKVLIIEDDDIIIRLLELALKTNDYQPIRAKTGFQAIQSLRDENPDLVLLDLGLPDIDGMEVLSQIRSFSSIPIIIVSARGKEREKVAALDGGADDYLTKPFNVFELLARIRVALRRSGGTPHDTEPFELKALEVDFEKRRVKCKGNIIHLTPIEYKLLTLLIEHRGKVLTHLFIQQRVWGYESSDDYQTLRVFMASIRRKIEEDTNHPMYIMTEVGVGYRFVDE